LSGDCRIEEASELADELVEALDHLAPQLSPTISSVRRDAVAAILRSPATHLLLARDGQQRIVGMLTLIVVQIPTGVRALIEDVVVEQEARGRGIGEALITEALSLAAGLEAHTVDLTSRPSREVANRLYEKAGFRRRDTNAYRFTFERGAS
jgi:ribosomal protein S18 acetylase RimI-like enzyme